MESRGGFRGEAEELGRNLSPIMKGEDNRAQLREEDIERGR